MSESGAVNAGRPAVGTVALVGAGVMGKTMLAAWLGAGVPASDVLVVDRDVERGKGLAEQFGVTVGSLEDVVPHASTVVVAVKPQDVVELLRSLAPLLSRGALVVSMAAGMTTSLMQKHLPSGTPVVRVMPNTPALVGEGMSAVSPGMHCDQAHVDLVCGLMNVVGRVVVVPESRQDATTAISGTGPAYLFYVVESMVEAGVLLGLPRDLASDLVVQTMFGAAAMLRETGEHPTVLRERVTSPAGTTVAAMRQLDENKVRAAFLSAMEAARDRSRELSGE